MHRDLQIRRALVGWFARGHRDLPWRRTRDPYAVWVSEIMLQQTQVATVTPYFTRWMGRFPTVRALAEAPLDDVLSHWAGLGYYARARNLHAAAREVATTYGGQFPTETHEVRALPGIGAYTTGAIVSIAYGRPEPIVDGNVVRVLARVDGLPGAADDAALKKDVWRRAEELVRADGGGDASAFNQAMMELGATVCTPRAPGCSRCPLVALCRARADDTVEATPAAKTKKPPRAVTAVALLAERDDTLLFVRRPPAGLWGGLWEPPMRQLGRGERPDEDAAHATAAGVGLTLTSVRAHGSFEHVLTHRRMQFHVFLARARGKLRLDGYDAHHWQPRTSALELGVAAWTRRIWEQTTLPRPASTSKQRVKGNRT
ncbi:MAG TPA: A/G-specific adenine glycosylase [Polyangia bacterium]|nr:A/G-specific adenine glycosylase [Polyangia bacterium]